MLAQGRDDAFVPVRMDSGRLAALADAMLNHAKEALDSLNRRLQQMPDPSRSQAEAVIARRDALLSRLDAVRHTDNAGFAIRIHGDYHLAQILRVEEDFVILDFEGEPARPIEERRAKCSPLRDVAGMLRSFSYAALTAITAATETRPEDAKRLAPWAELWETWVGATFLRAYLSAAGDAGFLPPAGDLELLLRAYVLDKALYELAYELNNRPAWVHIPLAGIAQLRPKTTA